MKRLASVLAAVSLAAAGTGTYLDANRPAPRILVALDAGTECVIPDCRTLLGRGAWDEAHAPVDCMAVGPYSPDGGPVWRGCVVFRAEYATGNQCLPSRCGVVAGENPMQEVSP